MSRAARLAACALVVTAAVLVFLPTLAYPFVFDDEFLVTGNAFLRDAWSPLRAFAHSFWFGTPMEGGYYRPLVVLSFALNGRLLGWSPWGFHLVNVLLHAANAALVLGLLLRLAVPARAAVAGALLFALHPAAAWPVGSIVARVDLLPALFVLLGFRGMVAGRPLATGLACLAALLSKESALAFVAVPFLALRAPLVGPPARRRLLACGVACLAAAGAALGARLAAGAGVGMPRTWIDPLTNPMVLMGDLDRVRASVRLAGRYLLYLVAPLRFSDDAAYAAGAPGPSWGDPGFLFGAGLLLFLGGGALALWWRRDRRAVFLAFALGAFLPAANILMPISSLYAQNFLYLPLLGVTVAAADTLGRRARVGTEPAGAGFRVGPSGVLAAGILALLGGAALVEARVWSSPVALFTAWTARFPNYPLAWSRLGVARLESGDAAGAEAALRRALELREANAEAHYNLSVALLLQAGAQGGDGAARAGEVLEHARRAAALQPDLIAARVNASKALLLLGRPAEAEAEARAVLEVDATATPARRNLAEALYRQERYAEALPEFRALARQFPLDPNVRSPFVVALLHAGDPDEARREAEAARRDFPDLAWFDFCLARVEARAGRAAEARALLQAARQRDPAVDDWIEKVSDFDRLPPGE